MSNKEVADARLSNLESNHRSRRRRAGRSVVGGGGNEHQILQQNPNNAAVLNSHSLQYVASVSAMTMLGIVVGIGFGIVRFKFQTFAPKKPRTKLQTEYNV